MTYEEKLFREMQQETKSFKPTVAEYEKQSTCQVDKAARLLQLHGQNRRGNLNTDDDAPAEEYSSGLTTTTGDEDEKNWPDLRSSVQDVKKNVKMSKQLPSSSKDPSVFARGS